jgi:DNA-binding NarL/FixJ family response regulator
VLRIVIAEDHPILREAVREALDGPEMQVVGEAGGGRELLAMLPGKRADVVLLDLQLPEGDGFWALAKIREQSPDTTVIVLSGFDDAAWIEQALDDGASAYVLKSVDPRDLPAIVRQTVEGTVVASPPLSRETPPAEQVGLSEREQEILRFVADGLTNGAIARKLFVTEQTIKFHLGSIYRKLGASNRTEATHWAVTHGVVDRRMP